MDHTDFELVSGGIIGREHRDLMANYQDAAYILRCRYGTVVVITDGCGSGTRSEVGAQWGARHIGEAIRRELERHGPQHFDWERVRQDVLAELHQAVVGFGGSYSDTVNEYFLFTVVAGVLAGDKADFRAIGDGFAIINDTVIRLGPWPNNQPPYLAYGLRGGTMTSLPPEELKFQAVGWLPLAELYHFLLGSDGVADLIAAADKTLPGMSELVGPIDQFWRDDRYFSNPDPVGHSVLLSRRLKLIARDWPKNSPQRGRLSDDTTFAVGRRIPAAEADQSTTPRRGWWKW